MRECLDAHLPGALYGKVGTAVVDENQFVDDVIRNFTTCQEQRLFRVVSGHNDGNPFPVKHCQFLAIRKTPDSYRFSKSVIREKVEMVPLQKVEAVLNLHTLGI